MKAVEFTAMNPSTLLGIERWSKAVVREDDLKMDTSVADIMVGSLLAGWLHMSNK